MNTSQNHWPALKSGDTTLHSWVVPASNGTFKLTLRNGSAGFLLAMHALWMSENVEDMTFPGSVPDDWGYAFRSVRGFSNTLSNHSSGTAYDGNATRHALGRRGTFSPQKTQMIRRRLAWDELNGCIRWGGDYHNRADEMHFEIDQPLEVCERVARRLMDTTEIGRRLIAANPGQRHVIMS